MAASLTSTFVTLLRESKLLEREQLDEIVRSIEPRFGDPKELAKELVRRGWLTVYQVNQIAGRKAHELVLGQFVLLDRLGEGAMGQVFKARQRPLERIVALKFIRKERLTSKHALARFQREAQAAARLSHPNIVGVFSSGEVDGTHFLAMEYVEGVDLAKLVKTKGPLPPAAALGFVRQAAQGLQHAHERGLVHRDIKPHNLLLSSDGKTVKILDMGLARVGATDTELSASSMTQEGTVMGTPEYLSPEQARDSHNVDIRADVYSLGCTAYFLLAGKPPFRGNSLTDTLLKHQLSDAEPLEKIVPGISPAAVAVVKKMMAKLPQDRYQTPAEAAAALAPLCVETGIFDATHVPMPGSSNSHLDTARHLGQTQAVSGSLAPPAPVRSLFQNRLRKTIAIAAVVLVLVGVVAVASKGKKGGSNSPDVASRDDDRDRPRDGKKNRDDGGKKDKNPVVARPTSWGGDRSSLDGTALTYIGFGDPKAVPKQLTAAFGNFRQMHWSDCTRIALHPSDKWIATGGNDGLVKIFEFPSGREVRTLFGHRSPILMVAFGHDGKRLYSASADAGVRRWDVESGKLLETLDVGDGLLTAATSFGKGQGLALGFENGDVRGVDLNNNKLGDTTHVHGDRVETIAFSDDLKIAISGGKDKLLNCLCVGKLHQLKQDDIPVAAAFSPVDPHFVVGFRGGGVKVFKIGSPPTEVRSLRIPSEVRGLAISGDGKTLVVNAVNRISRFFNLTTGDQIGRDTVTGVPVFRGHTLVGGGWGTPKFFDVDGEIKERPIAFSTAAFVTAVAFSPDGKSLAMGGWSGDIQLIEADSPSPPRILKGLGRYVNSISFDAHGTKITAKGGDDRFAVWDVATGKLQRTFEAHGAAFLPDGSGLIAFRRYAEAGRIDAASDKEIDRLRGLRRRKVWNVAVHPDGNLVALSLVEPNEVITYDLKAGDKKDEILGGGQPRRWLRFSPDGRFLAHQEIGANEIKLWDLRERSSSTIPRAHGAADVAFSPDGTSLATVSHEGTLRVWEVPTGRERKRIELVPVAHGGGADQVTFSHDGRYLAVRCTNQTAYILRLENP